MNDFISHVCRPQYIYILPTYMLPQSYVLKLFKLLEKIMLCLILFRGFRYLFGITDQNMLCINKTFQVIL